MLIGSVAMAQGATGGAAIQRLVPFQAVTTVNLNLRAAPSTTAEKVGLLAKGTPIEVLEVRAGWFRIGSGSNVGWVSADFVRLPTGPAGSFPVRQSDRATPFEGLTTDNLNLRSQPSITADKIGFLPPRRRLTVVEQRPDWYRIESEDLRGWVASLYVEAVITDPSNEVRATESSEDETSQTPAAVADAEAKISRENRQLRNENSRLAGDLAEYQLQIRQSVVDRETLQQELLESVTLVDDFGTENQFLVQRLEALNQEATATQERNAELEGRLEAAKNNPRNRTEVRRLRSEEKRLQKEAETLTLQIEQQQTQLVRVAEELKAAQADIEEANVALRSMLAENQLLRADLEAAKTVTATPAAPAAPGSKDMQGATIADLTPLEPLVQPAAQDTSLAATPLQSQSVEPHPPAAPAADAPLPESPRVDPLSTVAEAIEQWRAAWSAQEANRYLAAYAPNFSPQDLSLAAWQQSRRQRIEAPKFVEVTVGTLQVQEIEGGLARVRFTQNYRSDTFSDRVLKTLTLEQNTEGSWLILNEVSSAIP